jgi:hypothetical protein
MFTNVPQCLKADGNGSRRLPTRRYEMVANLILLLLIMVVVGLEVKITIGRK